MHGEGGDKVHGEHQVVQAGPEFRGKDVHRIQPNIWSMSSPRTELQNAFLIEFARFGQICFKYVNFRIIMTSLLDSYLFCFLQLWP